MGDWTVLPARFCFSHPAARTNNTNHGSEQIQVIKPLLAYMKRWSTMCCFLSSPERCISIFVITVGTNSVGNMGTKWPYVPDKNIHNSVKCSIHLPKLNVHLYIIHHVYFPLAYPILVAERSRKVWEVTREFGQSWWCLMGIRRDKGTCSQYLKHRFFRH
jgi:hypothetical protein